MLSRLNTVWHHAAFTGFLQNRIKVNALTVVAQSENNITTVTADIQLNAAFLGFTGCTSLLPTLDTVVDGIADHVLKRRNHTFEDGTVHFTIGIVNPQLDLLIQLKADLANNTTQAWHHALERNHTGLHQTFLKLRIHPTLLQQKSFSVTGFARERFFQIDKVGRRFHQCSRKLLHRRIAVHFQRIKVFVIWSMTLLAEQHLSFSFNIQTSQLVAHPVQRLIHLREGPREIADLLFQTPSTNRRLTGQVYETVEQIG